MKPLTPTVPHAIIMVGIPGSGKSTFAERFAKTFQTPFINEGLLRSESKLSADTAARIARMMLDELTKTGRTLIIEGPTHSRTARQALVKHLRGAGYTPLVVWVQTESVEAKRRATKRKKDGSGLTSDDFDAALKKFSPPTVQEGAVVISGKHTYATQLKVVLKHLASAQRPEPPQDSPRPRSRSIILR